MDVYRHPKIDFPSTLMLEHGHIDMIHYVTPKSVSSSLSKNQFYFLNDRTSDAADNHWWIIVLSKEEVLKTYRMSGYTHYVIHKS